jgi:hypothetical protein
MAQTISYSRGNTSYTANTTSSNALTVYTNGANPTRVIFNTLAWIPNVGDQYNIRFNLYLRNSGASASQDVPIAGVSINSVTSVFITPGQIAVPGMSGVTAFNYMPVTQGVTGTLAGDILMGSGANSTSSGYSYCPKNMWMGPNDLLIVKVYSGGSNAGTVVWNFTTITES